MLRLGVARVYVHTPYVNELRWVQYVERGGGFWPHPGAPEGSGKLLIFSHDTIKHIWVRGSRQCRRWLLNLLAFAARLCDGEKPADSRIVRGVSAPLRRTNDFAISKNPSVFGIYIGVNCYK